MAIILVSPLPPPSGGIASWTVGYKKYCEEHDVDLKIVNIAMQGNRATKETMHLDLLIELKRNFSILKNMHTALKNADEKDDVHLCTSCQTTGILRDAVCEMMVKKMVPIVLHCHCNIEDQLGKKRLAHSAFRYLIKRANKIIVLNDFSKKYVDSLVKDKSIFIPNYANNYFIADTHFINDDIKKILYVGHVERAKGIEIISEVAKKLEHITFYAVGAIREDISEIDIPDNLKLVGRLEYEDLKRYYEAADLFLFPSKSEGFSLSLLEAMGMGLPIIASDVGANSEMVRNSGGIILKSNDASEIVQIVNKIQSCVLRKQMSQKNIERVESDYVIEKVMSLYFEIYKSLWNKNA